MFKFIIVLLLVMFPIPLAISQGGDLEPESSNTQSKFPQDPCEQIAKPIFIFLVGALGEKTETEGIYKFSKNYARDFSGDISDKLDYNSIRIEFETKNLKTKQEKWNRDLPAKVSRKARNKASSKKSRDRKKNLHAKVIEEIYELLKINSDNNQRNNYLEQQNEFLHKQNELLQDRNNYLETVNLNFSIERG